MKEKLRHLARPMLARNKEDGHRAATQLELFFDLVFVIAIATAAVGLHHAIAEQHYADGTIKFLMAFFSLWWPWVHFTWFASAFDNDDGPYRVAVMVMMFGVIMIAAGIPELFAAMDIRLMTLGYVVIRLAYMFLWYRAGRANPEYKVTAKRYTVGQGMLQILWVTAAFTVTPGSALFYMVFLVGLIGEIYVPIYATKAKNTPWHKHHIIERYGLLNIIVLGEVLLSASLAMQARIEDGHFNVYMLMIAISAIIVTFSIWWLYFCEEEHLWSDKLEHVFLWGYGHFFIFAPGAAIGAGFAALVDASKHHGHGEPQAALWAISISTALYLFGLWLIRDRHILHNHSSNLLLAFAVLIALTPLLSAIALPALTVLAVLALVFRLRAEAKES